MCLQYLKLTEDEDECRSALLSVVSFRNRKKDRPTNPYDNEEDWQPAKSDNRVIKQLDRDAAEGLIRTRGSQYISVFDGVFICRKSLDSVSLHYVKTLVKMFINDSGLQSRTYVFVSREDLSCGLSG